jgi:hypothetical protein
MNGTEHCRDRGAAMVLMLVVVMALATAIGVSLIWVQASIGSVRRAEQAWVLEESLIAAVRLGAHERAASQETDCGEWPGTTYGFNGYEVQVDCLQIEDDLFLTAQVAQRSVRVMVAEVIDLGDRWRLLGWEWNVAG